MDDTNTTPPGLRLLQRNATRDELAASREDKSRRERALAVRIAYSALHFADTADDDIREARDMLDQWLREHERNPSA